MRRNIFVSVLLVVLFLNSCVYSERVRGSGNTISYEEKVKGFTELNFSHAVEADVEYGDEYKVVVNIDDNLKKYVRIEKKGKKLYIGMERYISFSKMDFDVHITMPLITNLEASGASEVKITGFKTEQDFTIDVSGATELEGFINVKNCYVELSGASEIELVGSARKIRIEGSGASELDLSDFKVGSADVNLSGASEVDINVVDEMSVDLSGASEVKYWGNPRLTRINTSGASEIKSMD